MRYSYHIFMFPFRWSIPEKRSERLGEQISFRNIHFPKVIDNWDRVIEPNTQEEKETLYNEKNYFYEFVHDALYDNGKDDNTNIVRHYERREPKHKDVSYHISASGKEYVLSVDYINLNIYSTGVGVLSFYLYNEKYADKDDVLKINQYGRRVYPPFFADKQNRYEIASQLRFEGLNGGYSEDFQRYMTSDSNLPCQFLQDMVHEVAPNVEIKAVIDDRMYTMSWYKNDEIIKQLCEDKDHSYHTSDYWYKYIFVDGGSLTCQNDQMLNSYLDSATYSRWQKWHSLYGMSRYSFVFLTNTDCPSHLTEYFETEYVRMAELVLVQKASVLRFSAEVTNISSMEKEKNDNILLDKVRSLHKEYIRFVNQVHFREVSAQDQAIELYDKLYEIAKLKDYVAKLDEEIQELYSYVTMQGDKKTNDTMSTLTWIATIFVPATFVAGVFGMNNVYFGENEDNLFNGVWLQMGLVFLSMLVVFLWLKLKKSK